MFEKELSSSEEGSVAFTVDDTLAGKIAVAAKEENLNARLASHRNASRSQIRAAEVGNLYLDLVMHGDYEASQTIQVSSGSTATFDTVPVGSSIYVEATAYYQENGSRRNLYKGHSKTFTVRKGENQVVFVLKRVSGGEENGGNDSDDDDLNGFVIYVSAGGDDTNGDGSKENPFGSITGAANFIGSQVDYQAQNLQDSDTDYIIKVDGMLSGQQSLSWWEHDPLTSVDAKSITIVGANGLGANGIPRDGFTGIGEDDTDKCSLEIHANNINVTLKNIKITGYKNGLCVGDAYSSPDDPSTYAANVILGSGVLITGVQCNHNDSNLGGGVTIKPGSTLYMKSGAKITDNETYNSGGGVNINDNAYFYMQGGEISNNSIQVSEQGKGVYVSSTASFVMSGDALVASDNNVYLHEDNNNYAKISIAGRLTAESPVATITPYHDSASYDLTKTYLAVTNNSGTSLVAEHSKFAVTPIRQLVSVGQPMQFVDINYIVNENGKLEVSGDPNGNGGGGGINGNVFYISPTGNDSNDGLSQSNAIATVQHLVEYLLIDEDADYIINVCGDMTTGSDSEWLLKNITGAKSITIQGNGNTNTGNKLPGVYTESKAPITFKNIQIGAMYIGAVQVDEDSYEHADVILDTGTLIQNNGSDPNTQITSIDGNGLYGVVHLYQKGAVTLTMKSGAVISDNTYVNEAAKQYGACGGVYIGQYSQLIMEGGTISGNAEYDVSNCMDGYFVVSGDAQAVNVHCKSYQLPDSQSVPVYIGGPLTRQFVANITPGFYEDWQAIELWETEPGVKITTTTLANEYQKFSVTRPDGLTSLEGYSITSEGKLSYYNLN